MSIKRSVVATALVAAVSSVGVVSCGGPSKVTCASERWEGMCQLKSVTKIRESEFPAPNVILEVMFAPIPNAQYPNFTPPELREEIQVMAAQEPAAREHLERNSPTQCHMRPPPAGQCVPGTLAVNLPPFTPPQAATATGPTGCAQIENQATQDRVRQDLGGSETLAEVILFTEGSAGIEEGANAQVQALAGRLSSAPDVECVAVVGQITPGEPHALAFQRAQAVKNALVARGIDGSRMMTIAVTENVFGTGTGERVVDPNARRVSLRIVLRKR
ncbi:MAG: hypothetical protein R3B13_34755 [Polyangiaceae bacterium]